MGEAFDVTIITTEAIGDLIKQGKLTGASRMDVGRSELGIGIRAGAPKPDIRTSEALKRTLQEAQSITYPQDGASGDPSADQVMKAYLARNPHSPFKTREDAWRDVLIAIGNAADYPRNA